MSTKHVIHHVIEPGLPGDGFTAPEVAVVREELERVAPPSEGAAADQLRVTMGGPRWLAPDSVSPLLFDAAADGATDDYAALMQAIDALGPRGGRVDLAGNEYFFGTPVEIDKPIIIQGGAESRDFGIGTSARAIFPAGSDGFIFHSAQGQTIRDMTVETTDLRPAAATTGIGIQFKGAVAGIDNVMVRSFGSHGIAVYSGDRHGGGIASHGVMTRAASVYNGGNGIEFDGSDSNVWVLIAPNVSFNKGWGINNDGLYHNTFVGAHALNNDAGDYRDDGWSSYWINPYAEMGGAFVVGSDSRNVQVLMGGSGSPTFTNAMLSLANSKSWVITRNGEYLTSLRYRSGWEWVNNAIATGSLDLRSPDDDLNLIRMGKGGGSGTLSFFGKLPVGQPSASANTSGATLSQLEAEVNSLKAKLRALGLMAT